MNNTIRKNRTVSHLSVSHANDAPGRRRNSEFQAVTASYKVVFNRKNKLNKDGKALVQIRAYMAGKNKYFSTGIKLKPSEWSKRYNQISSSHPNSVELNQQIRDIITKFERVELEAKRRNKPFSLQYLENYLQSNHTDSFSEFLKDEIEHCHLSESTKRDHRSFFNKLAQYKKDIHFSELSYEFVLDFESHLKNQGIHINTINKLFRTFKKYVKIAISKEMLDVNHNPFLKYRAKSVKTKKDFLLPEELAKIEQIEIPEGKKYDKKRKIKDMFLFACYTGLRFSDVERLKNEHIRYSEAAKGYYIEIAMQKTLGESEDELYVPLYKLHSGKPMSILDKYRGKYSKAIFEDVTNGYANLVLKDFAKEVGIKKNLTFHVSRHTCATFLLSRGMSLKAVQSILGHTQISTTEIYAKMTRNRIDNELDQVDFSTNK